MNELTLKIPHKAAARLAQILGIGVNLASTPQEKLYLQSLQTQLQDFAATQPPTYAKVTVLARDGIPVDE